MAFLKKAAAQPQPKKALAPNFVPPPSSEGPFIRIDAEAAKLKIVGARADGTDHFESTMRLHLDLAGIQTGWLSFQGGAGELVGDDRDNPPPGAGQENGPRWGFVVTVASPYRFSTDDLQFDLGIPAHQMRSSSRAVLEALGNAYDQYLGERDNFLDQPIPVFEVTGWTKQPARGGRKNYFAPVFELVGFVAKIDKPLVEEPQAA